MKRFHEILNRYGLKLMEVGTNHLRVFFGNRKLFDYYPLRMKVFDYRQWQQLTYPSMTDGTGKWETELDGIIRELMVDIKTDAMSEDRRETIVWDNIPEWALYALEYGMDEDLFITDEDREMVTGFITENFPKGYVMSVDWESYSEFDRYPAFGKPCKTYKVTFVMEP